MQLVIFGATIPDAKLAFEGDGEAGVEAEVSEKRIAAGQRRRPPKAALKSAVKQAVEQAVVKLGASRRRSATAKKPAKKKSLTVRAARGDSRLASPSRPVLLAWESPPMQPIEIALFGAVIALAAGLIGYLAVAAARGRGGGARGGAWPQWSGRGSVTSVRGRCWCVRPASASTRRACSSARTTRAS